MAIVACWLLLLPLPTPDAGVVQMRYIANSGFEITDGSFTLLVDFPYQSGAYGYMAFDPRELHVRRGSVCLFTHRHADHFEASSVESIGCMVAGPPKVLEAVGETLRMEGGPEWSLGGARVQCLRTEHGDVEHCSYLIDWLQRSILITGDVENLSWISALQVNPDTVVLPSWLAAEASRVRERFPGAGVVISHHKEDEELPDCGGCLIPQRGSLVE